MRRASKKDANQDEIVETARKAGASVAITHRLGEGFPDLVLGLGGGVINLLWELKVGKAGLTPSEEVFHQGWKGQIEIVRSPEQAAREIAFWKEIAAQLKKGS